MKDIWVIVIIVVLIAVVLAAILYKGVVKVGGQYMLLEDGITISNDSLSLQKYGDFVKITNKGHRNVGVYTGTSDDNAKYIVVANKQTGIADANEFRIKFDNIFPRLFDIYKKYDNYYSVWERYDGDLIDLVYHIATMYLQKHPSYGPQLVELFNDMRMCTINDNSSSVSPIILNSDLQSKYQDINLPYHAYFEQMQFFEQYLYQKLIPIIAKQILRLKINAFNLGYSLCDDKYDNYVYKIEDGYLRIRAIDPESSLASRTDASFKHKINEVIKTEPESVLSKAIKSVLQHGSLIATVNRLKDYLQYDLFDFPCKFFYMHEHYKYPFIPFVPFKGGVLLKPDENLSNFDNLYRYRILYDSNSVKLPFLDRINKDTTEDRLIELIYDFLNTPDEKLEIDNLPNLSP